MDNESVMPPEVTLWLFEGFSLEPCRLLSPTVSQGDTSHHLYSVESGEGQSDIFIDGVSHSDTSRFRKFTLGGGIESSPFGVPYHSDIFMDGIPHSGRSRSP
jgi:hypothetical protein